MSQPLFQTLRNSSSPREFTSSIKKIIKKNDPALRVKEIIPMILDKKQLILDTRKNKNQQQQQMIQSVGELFQWLMPEEEEIEEEIRAAACALCATPEVEAFFLEVMLPSACEDQAIIAAARVVRSLVRFKNERKLFTSPVATKQLLEMAARAPTQRAFELTFGAIHRITHYGDNSVLQNYLTEENAKLFLVCFKRAEDANCLECAAQVLLKLSSCEHCVSRISTEEFASAVLEKISTTKSFRVVAFLCRYIANAANLQPECSSFFFTEEAARILLRVSEFVNDDFSASFCISVVTNLVWRIPLEQLSVAMKEFCATIIIKCLDFAETDSSRGRCAEAIADLASRCESSRHFFANIPGMGEKIQESIKKMVDLNQGGDHFFAAIVTICGDAECARSFANLEMFQLLVASRKKPANSEKTLNFIDCAMNRIVIFFPEFLNFCTAELDAAREYQQRLLKEVTTLAQLATFLEIDSSGFFQHHGKQLDKRRTLLIVCEKLDRFMMSREENENDNDEEEFQKNLFRICRKFYVVANGQLEEVLNHQFLDTVVLSILQRGTGKQFIDATDLFFIGNYSTGSTCGEVANLIRCRIQYPYENPRAFLSSSMLKVILEKMDEGDEETCLAENFMGDFFFSMGIHLLRQAASKDSRDLSKTFFVDNLNLINRVFKKGYLLGNGKLRLQLDQAMDEIRRFDPRMKHVSQLVIEQESGQRRDRDGNPSTME
jgi:hypothetical protein